MVVPTYEYRCEDGHSFEVMQRMSDDPIETCTTCSLPVQRVLFPFAVSFKGKGFYSTDYGSRRRNLELKHAAEGTGKYDKGEGGSDSSSAKEGATAGESSKGEGGGKSESKGEGGSTSKGEGASKSESKGEPKKKKAGPSEG